MALEYEEQMKAMREAEEQKIQMLVQQQQELKDNLNIKEAEVSRIAELQQQKTEQSRQREELEAAQKVDRKEMEKLQE